MVSAQQSNPVDEIIKSLRRNPGFKAYLILNNDGIVIRWDSVSPNFLTYQKAVQYAHHVLDLYNKITSLEEDEKIESLRLRTLDYEMIVGQQGNFTLVVIQEDVDSIGGKAKEIGSESEGSDEKGGESRGVSNL